MQRYLIRPEPSLHEAPLQRADRHGCLARETDLYRTHRLGRDAMWIPPFEIEGLVLVGQDRGHQLDGVWRGRDGRYTLFEAKGHLAARGAEQIAEKKLGDWLDEVAPRGNGHVLETCAHANWTTTRESPLGKRGFRE